MNEKSLTKLETDSSIDIDLDKDSWIYIYGSPDLQQARSLGYECEERYLKERIKAEYRGFEIAKASLVKKIDFPSKHALKQSLKWNDIYISDYYLKGEVLTVDKYLGKYQLIKQPSQPWYILCKQFISHPFIQTFAGSILFSGFILTISFMIRHKPN
jgi:hypothetical protein